MEEGEKVKLTARVSGVVQGVGYRIYACRMARAHGLCGFVRNINDGSVEVVGLGPRRTLQLFLDRLRQGPFGGRVDEVSCEWSQPDERYDGFDVRF